MAGMRLPKPMSNAIAFLKELVREYTQDNGSLVAAALAFYLFVSLVPLMILAIAGLGYLLGSPERAKDAVYSLIRDYAPALSPRNELRLQAVIEEIVRGRDAATGIGVVMLIWSGTSLMTVLERAINVAWNIERQRMFVVRRLVAVAMLIGAGMLFVLSFGITAGLEALRSANIRILGLVPSNWPWIWSLSSYVVPLAGTILAFTLMYKFLPYARVPFRSALFGGLFAGALWEAAKIGFSFYLSGYASYGRIYGSLTGVVVLLIWINYSAVVAVLGAEASSIWARRHGTCIRD